MNERITHKRVNRSLKTTCGEDQREVAHVGVWKFVTCDKCKTKMSFWSKRTIADKEAGVPMPVIKVSEVDINKLKKFFGD